MTISWCVLIVNSYTLSFLYLWLFFFREHKDADKRKCELAVIWYLVMTFVLDNTFLLIFFPYSYSLFSLFLLFLFLYPFFFFSLFLFPYSFRILIFIILFLFLYILFSLFFYSFSLFFLSFFLVLFFPSFLIPYSYSLFFYFLILFSYSFLLLRMKIEYENMNEGKVSSAFISYPPHGKRGGLEVKEVHELPDIFFLRLSQ